MLLRICIYHFLRSVFVGFRTLICESGCKQVFLSPVTHIQYENDTIAWTSKFQITKVNEEKSMKTCKAPKRRR